MPSGWSPEQVAGWLERRKLATISHETIYRFIYAQIRRTNDGAWRHYLPRAKYKRGWRARPGGSPASFIKDRVSIALRPDAVQRRRTFGHWEADAETRGTDLQPSLDRRLRRTITFDNGTEFAQHYELTDELGIRTFFCDPHSPWQKGAIENAIGRMRRPLPRKTNLNTIDLGTLEACVVAYNNTPRKCLRFRSPAETFFSKLLHFKCESTPSLRSG